MLQASSSSWKEGVRPDEMQGDGFVGRYVLLTEFVKSLKLKW